MLKPHNSGDTGYIIPKFLSVVLWWASVTSGNDEDDVQAAMRI
jgi:hypothetical protein